MLDETLLAILFYSSTFITCNLPQKISFYYSNARYFAKSNLRFIIIHTTCELNYLLAYICIKRYTFPGLQNIDEKLALSDMSNQSYTPDLFVLFYVYLE